MVPKLVYSPFIGTGSRRAPNIGNKIINTNYWFQLVLVHSVCFIGSIDRRTVFSDWSERSYTSIMLAQVVALSLSHNLPYWKLRKGKFCIVSHSLKPLISWISIHERVDHSVRCVDCSRRESTYNKVACQSESGTQPSATIFCSKVTLVPRLTPFLSSRCWPVGNCRFEIYYDRLRVCQT